MFHIRSYYCTVERTSPFSDHVAPEPSLLYPHPLLSATCTPRVIPVVPNGHHELHKSPKDQLKLLYSSINCCDKVRLAELGY